MKRLAVKINKSEVYPNIRIKTDLPRAFNNSISLFVKY